MTAYDGTSSEQMFRLYALLAREQDAREDAERKRAYLARQLDKAADREAILVSRFGDNGPAAS